MLAVAFQSTVVLCAVNWQPHKWWGGGGSKKDFQSVPLHVSWPNQVRVRFRKQPKRKRRLAYARSGLMMNLGGSKESEYWSFPLPPISPHVASLKSSASSVDVRAVKSQVKVLTRGKCWPTATLLCMQALHVYVTKGLEVALLWRGNKALLSETQKGNLRENFQSSFMNFFVFFLIYFLSQMSFRSADTVQSYQSVVFLHHFKTKTVIITLVILACCLISVNFFHVYNKSPNTIQQNELWIWWRQLYVRLFDLFSV